MKSNLLFLLILPCIGLSFQLAAQKTEQLLSHAEIQSHVRFLAADELRGRKTGELSNWVAAKYIAEQFRKYGVKSPSGLDTDYFQIIAFAQVTPPTNGVLTIGDLTMDISADLIIRQAKAGSFAADLVYLPHALPGEVTQGVKDKIVLTNLGSEEQIDPQAAFALTLEKIHHLKEMGAKGIIEIYNGRHPWNLIKRYLGSGGLRIMEEDDHQDFVILTIENRMEDIVNKLNRGKPVKCQLETDGTQIEYRPSPNVVGLVEGSDPIRKNEFVVLSAHFDHVGTSRSPERPATEFDSIFNGARDNAFGVAALLAAAQSLSNEPPSRSILFLACTAEEMGLLGSKYFVEHPIVPLNQIIFNLNTDGAGHSDSTIISVMGLNRVGVEDEIKRACAAFGLATFADPAPEQNLFDRSDNVSFAQKGIPAPTFSPGFKEFDKDIMKHYHQPSDEVESLDFKYVDKFCRAYALCARLIADKRERPSWVDGDKYEPAFQILYQDQ